MRTVFQDSDNPVKFLIASGHLQPPLIYTPPNRLITTTIRNPAVTRGSYPYASVRKAARFSTNLLNFTSDATSVRCTDCGQRSYMLL